MLDIPIETLISLAKAEPGSGMIQSILLFLIWMNARGLKKELRLLKGALTRLEIGHEVRIGSLEQTVKHMDGRLEVVEGKQKGEQ